MVRVKQCRVRVLLALSMALLAMPGGATEKGGQDESFGLLVMAHGGTDEWNRAVEQAVEGLGTRCAAEIAFGMADAASIQRSVERLEERGVRRIGVVRLFISGDSWYERTRQILGLIQGASPRPAESAQGAGHMAHEQGPHGEFWQIETKATFALSREGLSEAPEMDGILLERALALSRLPGEEDILIVAHGPGDDAENERWIESIRARSEGLRDELGPRRVEVMTLREDWSGKRPPAEAAIRAFVERAVTEGGRALVIPFRVQGFGPYDEVLEGLDYEADRIGLLPHPAVRTWIDRQATELQLADFETPLR